MLILLTSACSNDDNQELSLEDPTLINAEMVTFSQLTDNVSVLIFGKNENEEFIYKRSINSGWSSEGKVSTNLERGDYKFIFIKSAGISTSISPVLEKEKSLFDNFSINSTPDGQNAGYILPVDEIWLSDDINETNRIYEIREETVIKSQLKRIVSQVVLNLKRGYVRDGEFIPLPFINNQDIAEFIQEVKFDISGVGKTANLEISSGFSNTTFSTNQIKEITEDGFASYEGPFVFPPDQGRESNVELVITPVSGSSFSEIRKTLPGLLEKNKQLVITLWITGDYNLFSITVDTAPITDSEEGDKGIWE